MDYQNDSQLDRQEMPPNPPYQDKRSHGLATASLVMGILSLATCCCIYSAVVFGALSIIFALLSKGGEVTMDGMGKTGLILGISGLAITIVLYIIMFLYAINFYGGFDEMMRYSNELAEQYMKYYR